jgi:Fe-S cluster assembly protein SufB
LRDHGLDAMKDHPRKEKRKSNMADTKFLDQDYKYGFKTDAKVLFTTGKGLNENVVRAISEHKHEPEWMLEYRLKALKAFSKRCPFPPMDRISAFLDFPSYTYYTRWPKAKSRIGTKFLRPSKTTFRV